MSDALVVSHLSKTYDDVGALVDFSVTCAGGELVALVGHNGSGKSTLLRIAAGLLEPTEGTVTVHGAEAGSLAARAELSFIPDEPVLYEDLSVEEHIEYVGRLHGVEEWPERAVELLERLALADSAEDLPVRFSRGLRQKTALVLGLVRPFSVLVVDEPFVGLDPAGQRTLTELLVETAVAGACVVVATHQLQLLDHADRCIGLRNGDTVFEGPVDQEAIRALLG
ncbi:MAG: ABC transporter ATP-binding protein [Acidimicrobiia bacterium]